MRLGKKAIMDDWMDVVFTGLILVFIFIFVYSLIGGQINSETTEIEKDIKFMDYESILLQYVKYNLEDKNIADLIVESHESDDFSEVGTQTESFFEKHGVKCWWISFSIEDEKLYSTYDWCYAKDVLKETAQEIAERDYIATTSIKVTKVADVIIPTKNPQENIQIYLFKSGNI